MHRIEIISLYGLRIQKMLLVFCPGGSKWRKMLEVGVLTHISITEWHSCIHGCWIKTVWSLNRDNKWYTGRYYLKKKPQNEILTQWKIGCFSNVWDATLKFGVVPITAGVFIWKWGDAFIHCQQAVCLNMKNEIKFIRRMNHSEVNVTFYMN